MALSPQEPEDTVQAGQPAMVTDASGVYVAQNEDQVYEEEDWEWFEASQLLEEEA